MLYKRFGQTGEMLSILGFGCMRFPLLPGEDPSKIDEEKSMKIVRYAIDKGVNYIDTAYPYHGGMSEPLVAKILRDGYREKVKLATKLPSWLIETREDMDKYLNEQLERLETDVIDFYLVHTLDKKVWEKLKTLGIGEFLDSAIADGRIKYAGFSYHDEPEYFNGIIDDYPWSFCQIQFNYLDEDFQAGLDGLNYAHSKGLGIVIMEPLRGGKLVDNLPNTVIDAFNSRENIKTPAEWALRWVWNHPQVDVVLSGMNEMEQVIENISIANRAEVNSLNREELSTIDKVKNIFQDRIKVHCTDCRYCMPCPSGVDIPKNFSIYNNYHLFGEREDYDKLDLDKRASNCIECGQCEPLCPQSIEIISELKNIVKTFK